jgi:hypothetical protein
MNVVLSIEAILTDAAAQGIAQMMDPAIGRSFVMDSFILGDQGNPPTDPTQALTPDTTVTTCMGDVFGPQPITLPVTYLNSTCPVFSCEVTGLLYTGVMSSLCLVARWVFSMIPGDPLVGQKFTAGVSTRPQLIIADTDDIVFEAAISA